LVGAGVRVKKALVRKNRTRARPTSAQVLSAARWAINTRWEDAELPPLSPSSETYDRLGWTVVFEYDGWRYGVASRYDDDGVVDVHRSRTEESGRSMTSPH
jgi:hypothetical protein